MGANSKQAHVVIFADFSSDVDVMGSNFTASEFINFHRWPPPCFKFNPTGTARGEVSHSCHRFDPLRTNAIVNESSFEYSAFG